MPIIDNPPGNKATRSWPSELDLIYNPSLGAYLIWQAALGHFKEEGRNMPFHLAFLVLPLVLHEQSRKLGAATYPSSSLTLYASKLGAHQEDLFAVHTRMLSLKELSLSSIALASAATLIAVKAHTAEILAANLKPKSRLTDDMRRMGELSSKFGVWFSRLPIEQVAATLRVSF
ncbi:three component ABC system middle component [Xanthomonas sp. D-109]|uniref:three component ABC system middle component n=1 Tax=Xanthomonas sp. D-109 TaxID=2821274 RepID=UPI001ADC02F2|nr:three component ABC system middle component [Xanthomonas sp. D-109]MBO9883586.1 hypothetical protein [Xanthomonas sp. D-109]